MSLDIPVGKLSDVRAALGPLELPLPGFPFQPNWHIFVTTPRLKELMARFTMFEKAVTAYDAKGFVDWSKTVVDPDFVPKGALDNLIPPTAVYMKNLLRTAHLANFVNNSKNYLRSYHFFGIQPQKFRGFTHYKDAKLDSAEGSMMHYPLSPYEFLLYGTNVLSCTEGVVSEVHDGENDKLREKPDTNPLLWDASKHLGNYVRIRKGSHIELTYGGLQKHSIKVKEGDSVSKRQVIGNVGCSAWLKIPFLYLQISLVQDLPFKMNLVHAFKYQDLDWAEHLQCQFFKRVSSEEYARFDKPELIFTEVDTEHIVYKPMATKIPDGCLVKSYRAVRQV